MLTQHSNTELLKSLPTFSNHFAEVNGTNIHYISGGHGKPLILIPGYPENWWAYHEVMPLLAKEYHVIVVEMRGMGSSEKPKDGYEKKNMAKDMFELVNYLGFDKIHIAGHDIGAHVAFSFAANYRERTSKLILLDTPHPDAGMYNLPMLPVLNSPYLYPWWLAFNQVKHLPEEILEGRMDIVIKWMFSNLVKNIDSISDFDLQVYSDAYNSSDAIRASNSWYQSFPQDIEDAKLYDKLTIPVLGIGGSGFEMLQMALQNTVTNFEMKKVEDCGHFLLMEKPAETSQFMLEFLRD